MVKSHIDVATLYKSLDHARQARGWSWRQLAHEIGVSPSLLSRLGNNFRPDSDGFATLVRWLGVSADAFIVEDDAGREARPEPDLMSELAPLLRARKDLSAEDVDYLEEVIKATLRRVRALSRDE